MTNEEKIHVLREALREAKKYLLERADRNPWFSHEDKIVLETCADAIGIVLNAFSAIEPVSAPRPTKWRAEDEGPWAEPIGEPASGDSSAPEETDNG